MPTLYENNSNTDENNVDHFGLASWNAQTFVPQTSHDITKVELYMGRSVYGSPQNHTMTVSIRATDGDGKATGSDLCSIGITTDNIPRPGRSWVTFTFSSTAKLFKNIKYAIVMRVPTLSSGLVLQGQDALSGAGYTDGDHRSSGDSGATWGSPVTHDASFKEYGNPLFIPEPSGVNFMLTIRKLVAAANNKIYYEDV